MTRSSQTAESIPFFGVSVFENDPAGTRRRIDVDIWLYLRRDVGQRIYKVFTN